jgi:hypothetical protein
MHRLKLRLRFVLQISAWKSEHQPPQGGAPGLLARRER